MGLLHNYLVNTQLKVVYVIYWLMCESNSSWRETCEDQPSLKDADRAEENLVYK